MRKQRLVVGVSLLSLVAAFAPQWTQAQAVSRMIYTSALDQSGAPVSGLGPSDFIVREDKVAREILKVEAATEPMQIALLIDNSRAAEQYIRDIREALPAFINALGADEAGGRHQVAVITLAERPTINTDYTFDLAQAIKGAQRIFAVPDSGTYLLDGIVETSRGIVRKNLTRPVIVAVTTEGPETSDRPYQAVLEPLRESGATFHVLIIGPLSNLEFDRTAVLDMGTKDSGGRNEHLLTGNALPARMKQLANDILHQYRITYARTETLIPPERVTVSAGRPGLTVRGTPARASREVP